MASDIRIIEPEVKDLQISSNDILGQASQLAVTDDATCIAGGDILLEITRRRRVIEDRFKEPCEAAFHAHRSLTALRDSVLAPLKEAQNVIDQEIKNYRAEVRRKREMEDAAARKAAEAKAEAERIAKAEEQMDQGDLEACKRTLEAPAQPVIYEPPKTAEAPQTKGISYRTEWFFEVTNPNAVPREYCTPDEKKIRAIVKGLQGATNIAGIRIWSEEVSSKRSA